MRRSVPPRLDDRSFGQLRADAIERIKATCPEWTDFSPSDPGIALAEVFAYLTQTLLYRLNRVPDKQYRAFLELLDVRQLPPSAATATLVFRRSEKSGPIDIPRGTRVAAENVVFTTMHPVRLDKEDRDVTTLAFTASRSMENWQGKVPARRVSRCPSGDLPSWRQWTITWILSLQWKRPPLPPEARAVQFDGKTFRIWREVANFAEARSGERVYVVDRLSGTIRFSPAVEITDDRGEMKFGNGLFAAVPPQGREIRLSYRTGGGAQGNLRPDTLNTLKDRIAGVSVTNPEPATGGRDAESLDAMLVRGPTDFHRLQRAVTARDFETVARRTGGIARAKAFTQADVWRHAPAG